jgi:hypothetical protein
VAGTEEEEGKVSSVWGIGGVQLGSPPGQRVVAWRLDGQPVGWQVQGHPPTCLLGSLRPWTLTLGQKTLAHAGLSSFPIGFDQICAPRTFDLAVLLCPFLGHKSRHVTLLAEAGPCWSP